MSQELVKVTINGREIEAEKGSVLIDVVVPKHRITNRDHGVTADAVHGGEL